MCLTRHKYFLIFLSFIMWRDCTGHRLSEDLNSINTCCCEENCNRENDAQKYNELDPHEFHLPCEDSNGGCCHANKKYHRYDYLKPIINNPEVSSAVKGWYLFVTDYPGYATASELEYLGKLKQGLLTEEEILYPMVPAMSKDWKKPAELANSEPYLLSEKPMHKFEVEEFSFHDDSKISLQVNDDNFAEYRELLVKLQVWAENFELESLENVKQRPEFGEYRFLPLDYFALAPIYQLLEAKKLSWIKNILIVVDSYDYTTAFDVSIRHASNTRGYWGPVIVLRINPRKFMDKATRPDADDVAWQVASVALGYYWKRCSCPSPIIAIAEEDIALDGLTAVGENIKEAFQEAGKSIADGMRDAANIKAQGMQNAVASLTHATSSVDRFTPMLLVRAVGKNIKECIGSLRSYFFTSQS